MTAFNAGRRNIIHTLRKQTATMIFEQPTTYFGTDYDRQSLPHFAAAIYPDPRKLKFSKYAPILFPDGVKNMNYIFRAPHLALV